MRKNKSLLFSVLLFLAALGLIDVLTPVRQFSAQENRQLAQKPVFSLQAVLNRSWMTAYEDYVTDQFPGRDLWITGKTGAEKIMGKKDAGGVYFAPGNTLLERHPAKEVDLQKAEAKTQRLLKEAVALQKLVPGKTGVMLVPSATAIWTERLPAFADEFDQLSWLSQVQEETIEAGLLSVDVTAVLQQHAKEPVYYGTDHHWTTLGAFYGYQQFAEDFGYPAPSLEDYERVVVKEDFWGTLQKKVNLPVAKDQIEIFMRPGEKEHPVTFVYEKKEAPSLYFYDQLETADAYAFFLNGNVPFLEIAGDGPAENSIFLIKDSYANCFVPFLTQHYGRIYVLDKRFYRAEVSELILQVQPTDILYLYNLFQFMENF